jgi:hypothetical protein
LGGKLAITWSSFLIISFLLSFWNLVSLMARSTLSINLQRVSWLIYMFVVSAYHEHGSLLPPFILYPGITNKAGWQEIKGVYPTPPRNLKASRLSTAPSL